MSYIGCLKWDFITYNFFWYCSLIIFELYYYINVSMMGFLLGCKVHTPNFLFSFKIVGFVALDGFDRRVWAIKSSYKSCMIGRGCPRLHAAMLYSQSKCWVRDVIFCYKDSDYGMWREKNQQNISSRYEAQPPFRRLTIFLWSHPSNWTKLIFVGLLVWNRSHISGPSIFCATTTWSERSWIEVTSSFRRSMERRT